MPLSRPAAIRQIKRLTPDQDWSDDPDVIAPYCLDHRRQFPGETTFLIWPRTAHQLADIVKICAKAGIGIVPQGGNTGLTGASVPRPGKGEILINMSRMNRIRSMDRHNAVITVEAGCILKDIQTAAEKAGFLFPLALASEGSCEIGGNIATNAGGLNVLRYGMTRRLVLGLEVVLADGRIFDGLRTLSKDNSGYDLKQLFIGSEGTLGLITAATLSLRPLAQRQQSVMIGVDDAAMARNMLETLTAHGIWPSAFEYIPDIAIQLVLKHIPGTALPFAKPARAYVLMRVESNDPRDTMFHALEDHLAPYCGKGGGRDAVFATAIAQQKKLWRLRETITEAEQREQGSLKHDISVAPADVPLFLKRAEPLVRAILADVRIVAFGHIGDGNIHYNLQRPVDMDGDRFLSLQSRFAAPIYDLVTRMRGSISAEHGIGQLRRDDLPRYKSDVSMDIMHRLKDALDPLAILNPGKVLAEKKKS